MTWNIAAIYKFIELENLELLQESLINSCDQLDICGIILVAPEGVNGTFAGQGENLTRFLETFVEQFSIESEDIKYASADIKPFLRMKVRVKREIITMRADEANPHQQVGKYVSPAAWNELIQDPDVMLLDTRNDFETKVGMFKNAADPDIADFTDFKEYVEKELDPEKHKKVAMYCTGGIRCEKASSYMLAHGFEEIYHLRGGILKYLEEVPQDQSLWEGDCFVFDRRVAVDHNLEESKDWYVCYGCRMPVHVDETSSPEYEIGVSCLNCFSNLTPERTKSLRQRAAIMRERLKSDAS
jgi:UPF0176 protein